MLSTIGAFWIAWSNNLLAGYVTNSVPETKRFKPYLSGIYYPAYMRMVPYLLGIMTYFYIYKLKKRQKTFNIHTVSLSKSV